MDRREFTKHVLMASAMFTASASAGLSNKRTSLFEEEIPEFKPIFNGKDLSGFVDVNTSEDTWWVEDGLLKCSGHPIGVMRTEKQYENFILDIEWRHMEPGGNSGFFILADPEPPEGQRFPKGMEVQIVDPAIAEIRGITEDYAHGQLFPVSGLEGTIPDNPFEISPSRANPLERRVRGTGEWNRYQLVCVDGTIKLAVNGKFVTGIRSPERKKGYICPESEGYEIHFRKIDIMELPGSVISPDEIAPKAG